jgi:hypothetical protein
MVLLSIVAIIFHAPCFMVLLLVLKLCGLLSKLDVSTLLLPLVALAVYLLLHPRLYTMFMTMMSL